MSCCVTSYVRLLTGEREPEPLKRVISPGFEQIVAARVRKGELPE